MTRPSIHGIFIALLLITGWTYGLWQAVVFTANCDIGWLSYATRQIMAGQTVYRDIYEVNPPLIFAYFWITESIANWLATDSLKSFFVTTYVLGIFLLLSSGRQLSPILKHPIQYYTAFALLYFFFCILPFNTPNFGEREHLFIILITPYLIRCHIRLMGHTPKGKGYLEYSIAALGFIIKPYFLLVFIASEFFISRHDGIKGRTPFWSGLFLLGISYVIATALITPYYFKEIIPLAVQTYGGHKIATIDIWKMLFSYSAQTVITFALFVFLFKTKNREAIYYWLAIIMASATLALIQNKGWIYTYFPYAALSYLAGAMVILEWLGEKHPTRYRVSQHDFIFIAWLATVFSAVVALSGFGFNNHSLPYIVPATSIPFLIMNILLSNRSIGGRRCVMLVASLMTALILLSDNIMLSIGIVDSWTIWIGMALVLPFTLWFGIRYRMSLATCKPLAACLIILFFVYNVQYANRVTTILNLLPTSSLDYDKAYQKLKNSLISRPDIRSIFVFNTNLYPVFPLTNYTQKKWASRYHHLWMLPTFYSESSEQSPCHIIPRFEASANNVYQNIYDDLRLYKPEWIAFDVSPGLFLSKHTPFNWHHCIKESHIALDSYIHSNYKKTDSFNLCGSISDGSCAYDIFEKK